MVVRSTSSSSIVPGITAVVVLYVVRILEFSLDCSVVESFNQNSQSGQHVH